MEDLICDDRIDETCVNKIKDMTDEEFEVYQKELENVIVYELLDRLKQGEEITCLTCRKGKYVGWEGAIDSFCYGANCNVCGAVLHFTPSVIVE